MIEFSMPFAKGRQLLQQSLNAGATLSDRFNHLREGGSCATARHTEDANWFERASPNGLNYFREPVAHSTEL